MKALAVLMFLLGVVSMLRNTTDFSTEEASYRGVAVNYAIYRNEVFRHVFSHRGISGDISLSALNMPQSWRAVRAWRARVEGGRCYVYGQASQPEIAAVRQLFEGSFALGMASAGRLVPVTGKTVIPVPAFVPEGALVSITEVN